ncbi:MAG: 1-deoxy-D-xylulose-5-phosphate reductoisomerase [Candidatus Omnitrophica bacterium]|nr:1-deoxy-D-xylulose-5-phosphate reductoisomerase [Candidatus Omnitrophota bacterium]
MPKRIVILGSTGSIGTNALDVIRHNPDRFKVVGLAANGNASVLARQAAEFKVRTVALYDKGMVPLLKASVPKRTRIYAGLDGVEAVARLPEADCVLVAIGGTLSILPLIAAIKAGKEIALASKEALVSAGSIVVDLARKYGVRILPVDSEHSAIFQCLLPDGTRFLRNIYLTGTGGPLKDVPRERFDKLPVSRVIRHPKWKMGRKITVDSATLMNKGLEVIEARWLFQVPSERIHVVIHPEAIIHSMVEFVDGTIAANLFYPDMRVPIAYAFSYPDRMPNDLGRVDFFKLGSFTFERPDRKRFPALDLAYAVCGKTTAPCVLNAANEEAVNAFLRGDITFTRIISLVEKIVSVHKEMPNPTIDDILRLDAWAKEAVRRLI